MSSYQAFKIKIVPIVELSRDGFHIILGFLIFLGFSHLLKVKLSSWKALIAPFIFALILEILDTRDALAQNYLVDILDSLRDIVITTFLPLVTIIYLKFKKID